MTMTTVELKFSLPDQLAEEVRAAGLLTSETVEALLKVALRARHDRSRRQGLRARSRGA